MQKGKIVFVGNFWEYIGLSIALMLLSIVTLGLALPYWVLLVVQVLLQQDGDRDLLFVVNGKSWMVLGQ